MEVSLGLRLILGVCAIIGTIALFIGVLMLLSPKEEKETLVDVAVRKYKSTSSFSKLNPDKFFDRLALFCLHAFHLEQPLEEMHLQLGSPDTPQPVDILYLKVGLALAFPVGALIIFNSFVLAVIAFPVGFYLPDINIEKYPVLVKSDSEQKVFNNEREILYQVLFDLKKDVTDLKKLVHDIMGGKMPINVTESAENYPHPIPAVHSPSPIQEAVDVEEETMSLEEVEKEMIRKALEKHNGRRKNAAADLKISERTLYRKIKEYNLE